MPKPYSDDLRERAMKLSWPEHLGGKLQPERQFGGEVVATLA